MASLYKNNGYWYVSTIINGRRFSKSLKTKERKVAYQTMPSTLSKIIDETKILSNQITFEELAEIYLNSNSHWSKNTRILNERIIKSHIKGESLPDNKTSRAIYTRHINCCWNWGLKNGLISEAKKLTGDVVGEARNRVFSNDELASLFRNIKCPMFNSFVHFAYYTGARSSEIRSLKRDAINEDFIAVNGKTGKRLIKLNHQAIEILDIRKKLWNYSKDFVSHKFKKECRKLKISNARFHDLRRTFGYNLIKQGISIYKVSKLLGHSSIKTTEKHYAPLLSIEVENFIL